jgi:hypothetical protein
MAKITFIPTGQTTLAAEERDQRILLLAAEMKTKDAADLLVRPPRFVRAWVIVDCRDGEFDDTKYLFRPDVEADNEREGWCRFTALPTTKIVSGELAERGELQPPVQFKGNPRY